MENGNKAMISVVIPLYNKAGLILNTLRSVLAQTYGNFEIVVVDDGSTDKSAGIVESVSDCRVRLIRQNNGGVSAARNRGITESKGEYIAFLDADDEWDRDYLEYQAWLIGRFPECSVFAVNYRFRYSDGEINPTVINKLRFTAEEGELTNYFEVASCSNCPLWTSALVVKKNAIVSIKGFPEGVSSGEDLLTWARLACRFKIAYSTKEKATYNLSAELKGRSNTGRPHDRIDFVGKELKNLYVANKTVPGLKTYLSFWHKMRASVYVRSSQAKDAIKESLISMYYNPFNIKAMAIILLGIMPGRLRRRVLNIN